MRWLCVRHKARAARVVTVESIMEGFRLCIGLVVTFLFGFFLEFGVTRGTGGSMIPVPEVVSTLPLGARASKMKEGMLVTRWTILGASRVLDLAAQAEPRHRCSSHALYCSVCTPNSLTSIMWSYVREQNCHVHIQGMARRAKSSVFTTLSSSTVSIS